MTPSRVASAAAPAGERLAIGAERTLRAVGDARTGLALLLLTGAANAVAAILPDGPRLLESWPYAVLLGALALSGVAAVAIRAPTAWREWRRPAAVQAGAGTLRGAWAERLGRRRSPRAAGGGLSRSDRGQRGALGGARRATRMVALRRPREPSRPGDRGARRGDRRGLRVGDGVLAASRRPGAARRAAKPGSRPPCAWSASTPSSAPDARPRRLDTTVTFLRDGEPVRDAVLRVNEPGDFDGYLVHPWTYGPAVRLRVTTLDGSALLDAPIPLDQVRDGTPVGSTELPTAGGDPRPGDHRRGPQRARRERGRGADGLVDSARLVPGEELRVGNLRVALVGFDSWVTFLSRRDPGLPVLFTGAVALCGALAVGFWLPRRRVTVRSRGGETELLLRGERFDRPSDELERLGRLVAGPR